MAEQSFEKHARFVPPYHFVALPLLLVCVVYFGSQAVRSFSVPALVMVALSVTRRVLAGELTDRKSIKRAVTRWRADHQRI